MTKEEIMQLKSGKKLNALVAENIMGWTKKQVSADECFEITGDCCANIIWLDSYDTWAYEPDKYSTDISEAWQVIEYLKTKGWGFQLKMDNIIWAELYGLGIGYFTCIGESAPEAICKVALLASLTQDIWYEK